MSTGGNPLVDQFIEGFIAALVCKGVLRLEPNVQATNVGFSKVYQLLDQLAAKEGERWLLRAANLLSPSNLGTFDYFVSALRSRQLGFASSPNPRYSEIAFPLSKPFAEGYLLELPQDVRAVAMRAADAFLAPENGTEIKVA